MIGWQAQRFSSARNGVTLGICKSYFFVIESASDSFSIGHMTPLSCLKGSYFSTNELMTSHEIQILADWKL